MGHNQFVRRDNNAHLLTQLTGGCVSERLSRLGSSTDGEPIWLIGSLRIPAVKQ